MQMTNWNSIFRHFWILVRVRVKETLWFAVMSKCHISLYRYKLWKTIRLRMSWNTHNLVSPCNVDQDLMTTKFVRPI